MSVNIPKLTLSDGRKVDSIGYGTFFGEGDNLDEKTYQAVKSALKVGYRFVDGAFVYWNQKGVGKAITEWLANGGKREELFVESKVWGTYFKGDRPKQCVKICIQQLGCKYLDSVLLHWPQVLHQQDAVKLEDCFPTDENGIMKVDDSLTFEEAWKSLEDCYKEGLVKGIGVCNFNESQLDRLLKVATVKPTIHQFESHPWLPNKSLVKKSQSLGMTPVAYCPVGSDLTIKGRDPNAPRVTQDPVVQELAKKYKKSPHAICLRFQVDRGVIPIPKSANEEHMKSNASIFDFKLTSEEIAKLEGQDKGQRFVKMQGHAHHKDYPFPELKTTTPVKGNLV